jgi:hypothetical protein
VREIVKQNCSDLLRDLDRLKEALDEVASTIPRELQGFYEWLSIVRETYRKQAVHILRDLGSKPDDQLGDITSEAQSLLLNLQVFNQRLIGPVLRARKSDRLCLRLLLWLHSTHPRTRSIPAGLSDGEFASWPNPRWPAIYFMPPSAQRRLLFLPLFFHEFGHILYSCYKAEMDSLVDGLQKKVGRLLEPRSQRDDLLAKSDEQKRRAISETWYEWMHELFCDALGFVMSGPAFAYSFSMYFRLLGRERYHLTANELKGRKHPVTRMRIRVLADRTRQEGYGKVGDEIETNWDDLAEGLAIDEDYYGFYETAFLPHIAQTIDEMLLVTKPRVFSLEEVSTDVLDGTGALVGETTSVVPVVKLLNQAWRVFLTDARNYAAWEKRAIEIFLGGM